MNISSLEKKKGLNEYLYAVDFPRESHVASPAMKIWEGIPTRMELTKMGSASFMVNTWNIHQEEIHLFQVCHPSVAWFPKFTIVVLAYHLILLLQAHRRKQRHKFLIGTATIRPTTLPQRGESLRKRNTKHSPKKRQEKVCSSYCPRRISTGGRSPMRTGYQWLQQDLDEAAAEARSDIVSSDCFKSCVIATQTDLSVILTCWVLAATCVSSGSTKDRKG